jgi:hypothetical protein
MADRLTQEQEDILTPFAEMLRLMDKQVRGMGPDELVALEDACAVPTMTNCGFYFYDAAEILRRYTRSARTGSVINLGLVE